MGTLDVITFGEPMAMFYANETGPLHNVNSFSRALAGAESNVACGLSRLNLKVGYMTKLGTDSFGKFVIEELKKEKVETEGILFTEHNATGMLVKSKVLEGDPEVEYYRKNSAASTLSAKDFSADYFGQARHLHVTGIPPAISEGCHEFTLAAMSYMRKNGKSISLDPNLRPGLWESEEVMIRTINDLAFLSDIFLPGLSEAQLLTGLTEVEEIADFYLQQGVKTIVIKLGPEGAYYKTGQHAGYSKGFKPDQVVDTVGAGDGFAVGVISSYLAGETITEATKRGNAIGALQVMSPGDKEGMPTPSQLQQFIESQAKMSDA